MATSLTNIIVNIEKQRNFTKATIYTDKQRKSRHRSKKSDVPKENTQAEQ